MYNVQVEIVDTPILQLLFANRLNPVTVVERIPELGDEKEIGTLDDAFLDGSGNSLAGFLFVAVILMADEPQIIWDDIRDIDTHRTLHRKDDNLILWHCRLGRHMYHC